MGNQTDYFEKIGYKPKYYIGDRVTGIWNKIPFVGTVGNDTVISEEEGPRISVHLDLPIFFEDLYRSIIICNHQQVKLIKKYV